MSFSFGSIYNDKTKMVTQEDALPGRDESMMISGIHFVSGNSMVEPFTENLEISYFAMGCFWGAERVFWNLDGVFSTASGYQGGYTPNPTWAETCTAMTGHTETVMVVFDPRIISYKELLVVYFESHNPTQFMGQGNDIGTEYRDLIFPTSIEQATAAKLVLDNYEVEMRKNGFGRVVTEIASLPTPTFFYAEEMHQQYLAKRPEGYCGIRSTGVTCPIV